MSPLEDDSAGGKEEDVVLISTSSVGAVDEELEEEEEEGSVPSPDTTSDSDNKGMDVGAVWFVFFKGLVFLARRMSLSLAGGGGLSGFMTTGKLGKYTTFHSLSTTHRTGVQEQSWKSRAYLAPSLLRPGRLSD